MRSSWALEVFPLNGFITWNPFSSHLPSALFMKDIISFATGIPFCRGFSGPFTFLSSSQHYHAKEFDVGCPTAVATLRFAWSLLSSLAPSQMIRRAVGRCLSRQQGSSWLLASTPISTSSSLGTSLWGKRSNIYPPFTKGACKSLLGYLHFLQLCSWTLVVPFFLPHRLEWYQLG